mgnify:CR=1 FL=1
MRYVVIDSSTGMVENVIEVEPESDFELPDKLLIEHQPGVGVGWSYVDGRFVAPEPAAVDLLAYAAQKRWEKEVGGTEVAGMPVFTDDRSKTLIMGARQAADADPAFTTQWKTAAGAFITLDAAMIMAISNAVLAHVAACFAREAAVIAAIEDETISSTAEIDSAFDAVEWPAA